MSMESSNDVLTRAAKGLVLSGACDCGHELACEYISNTCASGRCRLPTCAVTRENCVPSPAVNSSQLSALIILVSSHSFSDSHKTHSTELDWYETASTLWRLAAWYHLTCRHFTVVGELCKPAVTTSEGLSWWEEGFFFFFSRVEDSWPCNCFIQGEVFGFEVLLDSLHPRSTRVSWWSPVIQRESC